MQGLQTKEGMTQGELISLQGVTGRQIRTRHEEEARAPRKDLFSLFSGSEGRRILLHRGDRLLRMGDRPGMVYLVHSGVLKSCLVSIDGNLRILGFHGGGELLGMEALSATPARCDLVALDTSSVLSMPVERVLRESHGSPEVETAVLTQMERQQMRLESLLQQERLNAPARVAFFLLSQSELHRHMGCSGTTFRLPMTRRELARFLNLANETVSRIFTRLRREGVVEMEYQMISLLRPERLCEMVGPAAEELFAGERAAS